MRRIVAILGTLVGAIAAAAVLDALGLLFQGRIVNHTAEDALAALLGGVFAVGWDRFVRGKPSSRAAFVGAVTAGMTAFLLARSKLPWVDMGPIGAGPAGELPLLVLPIACLVAVLGVLRPRGAWRR